MTSRLIRLVVATVAGVLACGLPLWPIPYKEVSIGANPSPTLWIGLAAVAGLLAGLMVRPGLRAPILSVTLGFALAVIIRVGVETGRDPTSHNLWPIEVVYASWFGLIGAGLGVGLARIGLKMTGREHSSV